MSKPTSAPPRAAATDELLRAGLQLHQAGRVDEARTYYERVLSLDAQHPAANHLLGLVFLAGGDAARAVDCIARAVSARPDEPQYLGNLGVALNAAARHEEAIQALQRAIAANPDFAEAYSNLGMAYRALGQLDEALAAYEKAIALRPAEAGFHCNLGNTLRDNGEVLAAERAYRRALELRPGYPAAANGLGGLLGDRWAAAEGLETVDRALAGAPQFAELRLRRGMLLQTLGRLQEALPEFDRAIALRPRMGEPYMHRAYLLHGARAGDTIPAMEQLFTDATAPLDDRVFAGFGLAQALAGIGRHEDSVGAFLRVNRLHRERVSFSLERAMQELAASFDRVPLPEDWPCSPADGPPPVIFIVGLPRAGKSTLEAILGRHPDTMPMGELPTFDRLFGTYLRRLRSAASPAERDALLRQMGEDYLAEARALGGGNRTIIDTMPSNYRLIGAISAALPAARIIWCKRTPAEQCIGIFEKFMGRGHEYAFDLDELIAYHGAYRQLLGRWQARGLEALRIIDVGDLRRDRRAGTREVLDFCGLSWNDACLEEVESEPVLTDRTPEELAANRADHLAAWRAARPDLFLMGG